MKTYTNRKTAPLAFHSFNKFFRLPASVLLYAFSLNSLMPFLTASVLYFLDIAFQFATVIAGIVALIGVYRWKPFSWYALLAFSGISICYNLLASFIFTITFKFSEMYAPIIVIIGESCLIVYYLKRKPLFVNYDESIGGKPRYYS